MFGTDNKNKEYQILKKPIIFSVTESGENSPIFAQGDYDVFVGTLEEDKLPMYVVINRSTGVVESTHEVTLGYRSWLDGIERETAQHEQMRLATTERQLPLSLSLKN